MTRSAPGECVACQALDVDAHALVSTLSEREREVLTLLSSGRSQSEVSEALGLSSLTIKSHKTRIYRKLGVNGGAQAGVLAVRAGLL